MPLEETTTVINLRDYETRAALVMGTAVRIDRKTPWGNPFPMHGQEHMRPVVIDLFEKWSRYSQTPEAVWIREHVHQLRGKRLACHCFPLACHGDVLAQMADEGVSDAP